MAHSGGVLMDNVRPPYTGPVLAMVRWKSGRVEKQAFNSAGPARIWASARAAVPTVLHIELCRDSGVRR